MRLNRKPNPDALRAVSFAVLLLSLSCQPSAPGRPERVVERISWDTVYQRGITADDTLLGRPYFARAAHGMLVVGDMADDEILAFSGGGTLLWKYGRNGRGPGEFTRIRDIRFLTDTSIAVLDPDNARVTVLSRAGSLLAEISIQGVPGRAETLLPLDDGKIALWTMLPDSPLVELGIGQRDIRRHAFPWPGFQDLHPMAAQGSAATDLESDAWIWAFVFGDRWISATGLGGLSAVGLYPDSVGWPEVETVTAGATTSTRLPEEPVFATRSADIADGVVYVLATIPGSDGTVVDRYDLRSGRYIDSWLPPVDAHTLNVDRGVVYFLVVPNPYPGVLAAKPRF